MAIKMTKDQRDSLAKIVSALDNAHSDANALWQELESEFSGRSEKWQESEKGQEYAEELQSLEDWASNIEEVANNVPSWD